MKHERKLFICLYCEHKQNIRIDRIDKNIKCSVCDRKEFKDVQKLNNIQARQIGKRFI